MEIMMKKLLVWLLSGLLVGMTVSFAQATDAYQLEYSLTEDMLDAAYNRAVAEK